MSRSVFEAIEPRRFLSGNATEAEVVTKSDEAYVAVQDASVSVATKLTKVQVAVAAVESFAASDVTPSAATVEPLIALLSAAVEFRLTPSLEASVRTEVDVALGDLSAAAGTIFSDIEIDGEGDPPPASLNAAPDGYPPMTPGEDGIMDNSDFIRVKLQRAIYWAQHGQWDSAWGQIKEIWPLL